MAFAQAPELTGGKRGRFLLPTDEFVYGEGFKAKFTPVVLPAWFFSDLVEERQYEDPGRTRVLAFDIAARGKHCGCSVSTDVKY